ncbi:MAG: LON peptidase substrate-binding domain-containing protein [Rhodospirillaceae bacterium]|nr:LON peptidase substrate-binding domain-containing protein [Rhodospirillaceae bacterium]
MASLTPADLPPILPVFPLQGALLLPGGQLPLNIFEPRYRAMIEDAMGGARVIGMIQPKVKERISADDKPEFHRTGCLGKITSFTETSDGRYLINLTGVCRFDVKRELPLLRGYRRVEPDWTPYHGDFSAPPESAFDRGAIVDALKTYLSRNEYSADWKAVEDTCTADLVVLLAAMCPFSPIEKQALLEAPDAGERGRILTSLLAMGESRGKDDRPSRMN